MDDATKREIDKVVRETLRDAGIVRPPVRVEDVLEHLQLYREYYDLRDPGLLGRAKYKIKVHGRRLVDIMKKISLKAVLFYKDDRIIVDDGLPDMKKEWASLHESGHRILVWHRPYFYGDTAQTLNPDWHEWLEAEANYAASGLMFCGPVFGEIARDMKPEWDTIEFLRDHFGKKSYSTTLRRFVAHGPDCPMALLTSTPPWMKTPSDQKTRCRHFVRSPKFSAVFDNVAAATLIALVDSNARRQRGGIVADFTSAYAMRTDCDTSFMHKRFSTRITFKR